MTKPFSFDELLARVRAHLRTPVQTEATRLAAARHRARPAARARSTRDGDAVQLSAKEFELLAYFLRHPDQVLSREQILSAVWGYDYDPRHERRRGLRRLPAPQARRCADRPAPIETVRSVGYRLSPAR